jgi:3-oxosteroid 1-dehydrogenase
MKTRREILKGAAAAGVAAAFGAPEAAVAANPVTRWDREADIVCVGGGAAGCTAAVTAVDRGEQVILLERSPVLGGTTAKSGGVTWIPNHALLREQGIADDKHDCLRYMCRYAYPQRYAPGAPNLGIEPSEYRLLEAFYDQGSVMVDRMRQLGAAQFKTFTLGTERILPPDYGGHLTENKLPKGRALAAGDSLFAGAELIAGMESWLAAKGATILTEHRVTRVVMDAGRVIGVEAQSGDRTVRIRARKAVIFGTGGYAHNTELVRLYQPALYGACATRGSTGDFITIAGSAGARMGDLRTAWRSQVVLEEALQNRAVGLGAFVPAGDSTFMVNKYGRRVVNEKADYNDRTTAHFIFDPIKLEYPNQLLFMIFDRRTRDAFGGDFPLPPADSDAAYMIEAANLPELSANLAARLAKIADATGGLSLSPDFPARLAETAKRFGAYARSGRDEEWHRGEHEYDRAWMAFMSPMREGTQWAPNPMPNITMHPFQATGPYYAIILAPGALDTSGGPLINERGQVMGTDGAPVPGLYGAGNCIASPARDAYFGGGATIGLAMTFAFIAATHASQESARKI